MNISIVVSQMQLISIRKILFENVIKIENYRKQTIVK